MSVGGLSLHGPGSATGRSFPTGIVPAVSRRPLSGATMDSWHEVTLAQRARALGGVGDDREGLASRERRGDVVADELPPSRRQPRQQDRADQLPRRRPGRPAVDRADEARVELAVGRGQFTSG